jgi:hypothetical protein
MSKRREQSQGQGVPKPAQKYIGFHGKKGVFSYYDKSVGEKGENVEISPKFLIVKELTTVTGFNRTNGGLYSNEIEDLTEELDVKYFKGDNKNIIKGIWKDIKDKVNSKNVNGKFTRSIYIALFHNKEWSLQNIQLFGKQITSWIEMENQIKSAGINKHDVMISIDKIEYVDNGDSSYYFPTFKYQVLDDSNPQQKAIMIKADAYYDVVEDYLTKKKSGAKADQPSARTAQDSNNTPKDLTKEQVDEISKKDSFVKPKEEEEDDMPWD